jgi:acetyl-CoA/propionyl-CoA carboxylase, biotin carboxylase, biotin carboxyl carrier protein
MTVLAFDTLLVANRGEIAVRVIRAARRLGLRTVAIYSDPDRGAPHVVEADRAVRIGPGPAAESYLSVDAILRAATKEGANAVHPGYGFLAENATFAQACESAGLVFVGPQPAVIDLMSRKDRARQIAVDAGAPVVPAVELAGDEDLTALAARVAGEIGFPALVKAVAGGGGKGMRVVAGADELEAALTLAGREALAAFGDPSLFVEKYMPRGRHLEVQLVGDGTGQVVHVFDRDCSVQRRHQKVVEEAPASVNSETARARAMEAAVRIGSYVSYRSLGTVEFLAVGDDVFFLEMNTRLQVEHPVTEAVTGLDLVELQLRLAGGEALGFEQEDVTVSGHAIEGRVYAEDPGHEFLPQAGTATLVEWPANVRVDAALDAGQEVGTAYDPMLGKLVAYGPNREAARRRLVDALDETAIFGLTTNLGFLRRLIASRPFAQAEMGTSWLDEHAEELGSADWQVPLAAAALWLVERARLGGSRDPFGPDGWRPGGPPAPTRLVLVANGDRQELSVQRSAAGPGRQPGRGDGAVVVVRSAGVEHRVEVGSFQIRGDRHLLVELEDTIERFAVRVEPGAVLVAYRGESHRFAFGYDSGDQRASQDDVVVALLPGILVDVSVTAGDSVRAGEVLGVLESMKMEYSLKAPAQARVERVGFPAGSRVSRGDVLFELVPVVEPVEPVEPVEKVAVEAPEAVEEA